MATYRCWNVLQMVETKSLHLREKVLLFTCLQTGDLFYYCVSPRTSSKTKSVTVSLLIKLRPQTKRESFPPERPTVMSRYPIYLVRSLLVS